LLDLPQGREETLPGWFTPRDEPAWRERLGLPQGDAPDAVFDLDDYRMGALLSLAGPPGVMLLADSSFGGILDREHAATFVRGRLVKAAGLDHHKPIAYVLEGRAWRDGPPGDPTSDCAALLHPVLGEHNLYDANYLPRDGMRGTYRRSPPAAIVPWEGEIADWGAWFPALLRGTGREAGDPSRDP
jgi:hypothetical protein